MKRKILPLAIIPFLVLQGCSCQQRLERLRRQCPECFTQTTDHVRDTLDTLTVPEKILTGSVPWAWLPSGDTVLFQNRDITLQLLLEGDSLRADVTVQPDTIPVDHEVTLPCPECDNRRDRLHPDVAVAAALLALLFIWGIAREVRLSRRK